MRFSVGSLFQWRTAQGIVTRHVNLRARGLKLAKRPIRIVLASDLHAHIKWLPYSEVIRVVKTIEAVPDVDFVAMPGDFTGDDPSAIDAAGKAFEFITKPIVATFGNHDHWAGTSHASKALAAVGANLLTNRSIALNDLLADDVSDTVYVAGIDSCWTRKGSGPGADPDKAFKEVPEGAEVIVLGHEPKLATLHQHALHLAGHTHLGQVRTPILGDYTARMHMPRYSEPYPCRLYELPINVDEESIKYRTKGNTRWIYTTAGIGFSTLSVRMFCPPEIVIIDC